MEPKQIPLIKCADMTHEQRAVILKLMRVFAPKLLRMVPKYACLGVEGFEDALLEAYDMGLLKITLKEELPGIQQAHLRVYDEITHTYLDVF